MFAGQAWFETRENCKAAAKAVREEFRIPCRSIVVKESGYFTGYVDRYCLILPANKVDDRIKDFIRSQEGYSGY